ncbi:hypothetical protein Gotur_027105 [Gossypium turneri]
MHYKAVGNELNFWKEMKSIGRNNFITRGIKSRIEITLWARPCLRFGRSGSKVGFTVKGS